MIWVNDFDPFLSGSIIIITILFVAVSGLLLLRNRLHNLLKITPETNDVINGFFSGGGVIYSLIIGLVAISAWQNRDAVDVLANKEALSIATLYRSSSLLKEPTKTELEDKIINYLDYVINIAWPAHKKGIVPNEGAVVMSDLLKSLSTYQVSSPVEQVFFAETISQYNKLIENRRMRIQAVGTHIPSVFWFFMILGGVLMIVATYAFYIPSLSLHIALTSMFSIFLGFALFLIAAIDNPMRGYTGISPYAYQSIIVVPHKTAN